MLKFGGYASMASCYDENSYIIRNADGYGNPTLHTMANADNMCSYSLTSVLMFLHSNARRLHVSALVCNCTVPCLHYADTYDAITNGYAGFNGNDTETCMCRVCPNITMCVRIAIGSRNRTIHNVCHISLNVSSGPEPTHQSQHAFT